MLFPAYLSAFRGSITNNDAVQPPAVSSPVGAGTDTTAGDQARALRKKTGRQETGQQGYDELPDEAAAMVRAVYGEGGFDAVRQLPNWYDLPESQRTQILAGARMPV